MREKARVIEQSKVVRGFPRSMFAQQFIDNQICFVSGYYFRSAGKFPQARKGCESFEMSQIQL